jgi:hypothetical protein
MAGKNALMWWILGGTAAVAAAGTAIYFATRKETVAGGGGKLPDGGGGGGTNGKTPSLSPEEIALRQQNINLASMALFGGGATTETVWLDAKGNVFTPAAWWDPKYGPPCPGCTQVTRSVVLK